jgi:hypothetical protein
LAIAENEATSNEADEEVYHQQDLDRLEDGDESDDSLYRGPPWPLCIEFLRPQRDRYTPARDRYFTIPEADEGDPLCLEDPNAMTTDTESHIADDWDEDDKDHDDEFDPDEDAEDFEMVQRDHRMSP